MKLKEIYNSKKPVISIEIFPPKTKTEEEKEAKTNALFEELKILAEFNLSFISVTYGAGGSTRERTLELVLKIKNELNIPPMPHFTCVGANKAEILQYLKIVEDAEIHNILALRGDPPKGETEFIKPEDGFGYANELVDFIRNNTNLGIAVAGYPEGHPECENIDKDIENLKRKVDAGADVIITQLFLDNEYYFNFLEKTSKAGINIPVIPGIMPITNFGQIERMTSMCSAVIPESLMSRLNHHQDDKNAVKQIGIEHAMQQSRNLIDNNVCGIHFYPLNKSFAVKTILEELNLKI